MRRTRGYIYGISHPAHPGFLKVGRAKDLKKRLSAYQTYCPHSAFTCEFAFVSDDVEWAEQVAHEVLAEYRTTGEWFFIGPSRARRLIGNLTIVEELDEHDRARLERLGVLPSREVRDHVADRHRNGA